MQFLMQPKKSLECHQILSLQVGSGIIAKDTSHGERAGQVWVTQTFTKREGEWDD